MPLTFDLTNVKAKTWEPDGTFDEEGNELGSRPKIVVCLIWTTMSIGLNKITEDNWEEFYTRMYMLKLDRSLLREDENGELTIPVSPLEVKDHIGLKTNARRMDKDEFLQHAYRVAENRTENKIEVSE